LKLYVTRHGPAEEDAPSGLDGDRALSEAGRKRVTSVAKTLVDLDEAPLRILSSPLVRAVQTAEIIAVVTKLDERGGNVEIRRELSPEGDAMGLVRALVSNGQKRAMLVGHEPDLSHLVSSLLGTFGRGFDKAMVVGVSMPSSGSFGAPPPKGEGHSTPSPLPRTRLRFVLDPKALRLDPDAREQP
jgi:phosphohistidine phosphatase